MILYIKKVLNSSVVLATDSNNNEIIVLGKGIGYGKKAKEHIDQEDINRLFVPIRRFEFKQIEDTLSSTPTSIVDITQKIIKIARSQLPGELNRTLTFSLMDHIRFSLNRFSEGIVFKNKLYWEVKTYYPIEFKIGEKSVKMINQAFDVSLPEEEAASIAFHIINAEKNVHQDFDSMEMLKLVNNIMSIITSSNQSLMSKDSISYQRLVTHIKFFSQRILQHQQLDNDDEKMYQHVVVAYPNAMRIAIKVVDFLNKSRNIKITDEEIMYLIIHIQRNIEL